MSAKKNAVAAARGAAEGAAGSAVVIGAGRAAMAGLRAAAPRAAPVVARGAGMVLSAPVMATAAAAGAVYGGVKAYRGGARGAELALATGGGALSFGTNMVADAVMGTANAQSVRQPDPIRRPGEDEIRRAQGRKGNGEGKKSKDTQNTQKSADFQTKPTTPSDAAAPAVAHAAPPAPPPKKGALQTAKEAVFGEGKAKAEDSLDKAYKDTEDRAKQIRRQMESELGGASGQRGIGPNYRALQKELEGVEKRLGDLTKQKADREDAQAAIWRAGGAAIGGALVGAALGRMTHKAAEAAVKTAEKGIATVARNAGQSLKAAPKGVIAGTVEGDKAAAAVKAAADAVGKSPVSAVEAFGLPAANVAHGAAVYAYADKHPDSPVANALKAEGTAAIVAGAVGFKYGLAARAMRPNVSPGDAAKLNAAANRLAREPKSGPSGVATARGRQLVSRAEGKAGVESARAGQSVNTARDTAARTKVRTGTSVEVEGIRSTGRMAEAKHKSTAGVVTAGSNVGVAKARGAARVEAAEIAGKARNSRAIGRNNVDIRYKDVWQDKKGRTYHRKDMSVRTRKGKAGAANDNGGKLRKAGA